MSDPNDVAAQLMLTALGFRRVLQTRYTSAWRHDGIQCRAFVRARTGYQIDFVGKDGQPFTHDDAVEMLAVAYTKLDHAGRLAVWAVVGEGRRA